MEKLRFDWQYWLSRFILLTLGVVILAASMILFYIPAGLPPAGASGLAVILNHLFDTPIGMVIFWANVPILILGAQMLTGWRTFIETAYAVVLLSVLIDAISYFFDPQRVSDDMMLNALFGGAMGGIGVGLVFRAGGTLGGTSTLARILYERWHIPLGTSVLYTDTFILVGGGFVFGWEAAMYATLSLFINRVAMDYIIEGGGNATSTAIIITREQSAVVKVLRATLQRGMTMIEGRGSYANAPVSIILLTLSRSEVNMLRKAISIADPGAFITVLKGQITFGRGFTSLQSNMPLKLDEKDDSRTSKYATHEIREIVAALDDLDAR